MRDASPEDRTKVDLERARQRMALDPEKEGQVEGIQRIDRSFRFVGGTSEAPVMAKAAKKPDLPETFEVPETPGTKYPERLNHWIRPGRTIDGEQRAGTEQKPEPDLAVPLCRRWCRRGLVPTVDGWRRAPFS